MLIYVDDTGSLAMANVEGFTEEPFCSSSIPLSCEEKIQSVSILVNGSIQPSPFTFDLHVDFIDPPSMAG